MIVAADNSTIIQKNVYIYKYRIEWRQAPKIYIRTNYISMGQKIKYEINSKDTKRIRIYA